MGQGQHKKNQKNIYAGSFCRPPNHRTEDLKQLEKSLETIKEIIKNNPNNTIILEGDFNARDINWENSRVDPSSKQKSLHNKLL